MCIRDRLNRGTGADEQYYILDVHAGMEAHDSGDTSVVTDQVYQKLQYALTGCHNILGEAFDYVNATASQSQGGAGGQQSAA